MSSIAISHQSKMHGKMHFRHASSPLWCPLASLSSCSPCMAGWESNKNQVGQHQAPSQRSEISWGSRLMYWLGKSHPQNRNIHIKFQSATQTYKWRLHMHKIITNVPYKTRHPVEKGRIRNSASWKIWEAFQHGKWGERLCKGNSMGSKRSTGRSKESLAQDDMAILKANLIIRISWYLIYYYSVAVSFRAKC